MPHKVGGELLIGLPLLAASQDQASCPQAAWEFWGTGKHLGHRPESWIVYTPTPRLGRKVTFGSDNREGAVVFLLVARARLPTTYYNGAGEEFTYDATYTRLSVETLPWSAQPCISREDKAKIVGFEPQVPNAKL